MKSITILSKGKSTSETLFNQLNDLLGEHCQIRALYLDGLSQNYIEDELIILSSQICYDLARPHLNPDCPVIIARRSINYHEIDKLLSVPAGTEVLLINDCLSTAEETISLLKALGINHLNYFPYAPEAASFPYLSTAITPGETELVPGFVKQIIDIKTRNMDFTTLFEILRFLDLADEKANLLSAKYLRDIIDLIKKTKNMAEQNKLMKCELETIMNTVHDGICALDENGRISVFNRVAEEIVGISKGQAIGCALEDKALPREIYSLLRKNNPETERFVRINNRHVVVSQSRLDQEGFQGQVFTLKDVTEIQRLEEELRRKAVAQKYIARYTFENILGSSAALSQAKALAGRLASSDSPVLIQGESGTGKELFAQSIHNASRRKKWPFVAVNVAALPESLLESELFGYIEGAFTGAKKEGASGLFEQAHKGTIFLDEIGDAPLTFQVKLLRVLQEKQVRRIGDSKVIPVDVRIIVATNKVLKELIGRGLFRQDLYYRLNVLPLYLPPLRERKEDIIALAVEFYLNYFQGNPPQKPADYFREVEPYFLDYDWPGNIRELHNIVEYLVNICIDSVPGPQLLPGELTWSFSPVHPIKNLFPSQILALIASAQEKGNPIGRRTLSAALSLPETQTRKIIQELANQGFLKINRGIKGLELTPSGFQALHSNR